MPAQSGQPTDAADALEEAFMEGDKAWAKGNGDQESLLTKGRGEEMKIRHWKTLGSLVGLWTTGKLMVATITLLRSDDVGYSLTACSWTFLDVQIPRQSSSRRSYPITVIHRGSFNRVILSL